VPLSPRSVLALAAGGAALLLFASPAKKPAGAFSSIYSLPIDPNDLAKAAVAQAQAQRAAGDTTANGKLLTLAQAASKAGYVQAAQTLMAGGGAGALLGAAEGQAAVSLVSPRPLLTLVPKVA
jgi:hypothetical protein